MDFETLLAQLINPGEDGPSDSIYDDLGASYNDATSSRDAKIDEQAGLVAELTAELTRTKLLNYELMLSQAVEPETPGDSEDEDETETENDSDSDNPDDDFFE